MVQVVIILAAGVLLGVAFGLLPSFPETPAYLENVASSVMTIISQGIYLLQYIVGSQLFFGTLVVISVILLGEPIYHAVMWVLKKIPVLGIK